MLRRGIVRDAFPILTPGPDFSTKRTTQGVGAEALALGDDKSAGAAQKNAKTNEEDVPKAGLRQMNAMAGAFSAGAECDSDAEDPNMLRFVEDELAKRRRAGEGERVRVEEKDSATDLNRTSSSLWETPAELLNVPREDEESAERYLTGIVEVRLPMEYKFRNIEETEAAKAELLKKQRRRDPFSGSRAGASGDEGGGNFSANFALHKKQFAAQIKANQNREYPSRHRGDADASQKTPTERPSDGGNRRRQNRAENVASDEYVFKRWMNNEKKRKH